jgi:energy-coupling factor transporter ATP-binding protein EcfA2
MREMTASALRLTAMTLRGVGPYLRGTRLDIRPITVLCGRNGTGKSAWLKTLNMLSRSLADERHPLPFGFTAEQSAVNNIEYMNAYYHLKQEGDRAESNRVDEAAFGPPGTVGLEFCATQGDKLTSLVSPFSSARSNSEAQAFLWQGKIRCGMRFRVRLAHPTHWTDLTPMADLEHLIELVMDDVHVLRLRKPREWGRHLKGDYTPQRYPYTLECSRSFVPNVDASGSAMIKLAEFQNEKDGKPSQLRSCVSAEMAHRFFCAMTQRVVELLERLLSGYFYLGAIRRVHSATRLDGLARDQVGSATKNRYVGPEGEHTHALALAFARNQFVPVGSRASNSECLLETWVSQWLKNLVGVEMPDVEAWPSKLQPPRGFLAQYKPSTHSKERRAFDDPDSLALFDNGFFYEKQPPKQFSSGFHQVAPIVVQTGLMKRHELLAIENPEVHLHPDSQLDIAEFLMRQAVDGRNIIIETHSDLVVRRLLRAILAEEEGLSQANVGIYFTELESGPGRYKQTILKPLQIGEDSRVKWPRGFLDASIGESQRLMDVMYGPSPQAEEEGQ